jgi:hypothetical protein
LVAVEVTVLLSNATIVELIGRVGSAAKVDPLFLKKLSFKKIFFFNFYAVVEFPVVGSETINDRSTFVWLLPPVILPGGWA